MRMEPNSTWVFSRDNKNPQTDSSDHKLKKLWVRILLKPDLATSNMTSLNDDIVDLIKKRMIDIVGYLGKNVEVSFVNLVNTRHGGDNVKVVSKAIAKHLFETIKEKDKNPTLNSDENENENQNLNFNEAENPNL
ncbi:unnamed protein product [Malus baccata var. baccata]